MPLPDGVDEFVKKTCRLGGLWLCDDLRSFSYSDSFPRELEPVAGLDGSTKDDLLKKIERCSEYRKAC